MPEINARKVILKDRITNEYLLPYTGLQEGNGIIFKNNIISAKTSVPFCINSGKVNSLGEPDIFNAIVGTEGTTTVTGSPEINFNFETATAGNYTINVPVSGYYSVIVVGAGANGGLALNSYSKNSTWGGGSGAAFVGELYLTEGTHTVTVGGVSGGASSIDGLIVAGGGQAGSGGPYNLTPTSGAGGTISVTGTVRNVTLQSNGNKGAAGHNDGFTHTSGGASVYSGYGAGGASNGSASSGFVSINIHIPATLNESVQEGSPGSNFLSFKVSEQYPLFATLANGDAFSLSNINTVNLSEHISNGEYIVYLNDLGNIMLLFGKMYIKKYPPSNPSIYDVWLNTSCEPCSSFKWNGSKWKNFNYVPIGTITLKNTQIMGLQHFPFNTHRARQHWISDIGYPSNVYENLGFVSHPLTTSTCIYNAPANGWINIFATNDKQGNTITLLRNDVSIGASPAFSPSFVNWFIPVCKGDVIKITSDATSDKWYLNVQKFYYAKGEI